MMALLLLFLSGVAADLFGQVFPAPSDFGPTNSYGADLQRSMRLLESSSPTNHPTVKVLFYGQSITALPWSLDVADFLRRRYPDANLIITNRAIAGFTSDVLVKTAETDLYPFYPDLLIFQDYGPTLEYEQMIAKTRLRTTADILIQTDHPTLPAELTELTDPRVLTPADGTAWRNYSFLPEVARKYGAELGDIRTPWKHYLISNNYGPSQLLQDVIHPNAQGNYLLAQLVEPFLRVDYSFPAETWNSAMQTQRVGLDVHWSNNVLTVPFTGNRIDLVLSSTRGGGYGECPD
jgi:hypothetical protein